MSLVPADVLKPRPWLRCSWPFPHLVARDVFKPDFYQALEDQLRGLLRLGLSERAEAGRFSRSLTGYDAYAIGFRESPRLPTGFFCTPAWRDLLAGVWDVPRTPYVLVGAHHHAPGSQTGFIHNDFNPVWFPLAPNGRIQTPDETRCAYKTGAGSLPAEAKVQVVRGAALIFYLANDDWRRGDGGETGLFKAAESPLDRPASAWPPENNSLISFECTPRSFHTFLANPRIARTSIIMWVHRPREDAVERYGEDHLEHWQR